MRLGARGGVVPHRVPAGRAAAAGRRASRSRALARRRSSSTIAIPLLIALAVIRVLVYALRGLFAAPAWLPVVGARDRVLDLGRSSLLYFIGVLPELARELDALGDPGRQQAPSRCSTIAARASSPCVAHASPLTLWLSGLIEQRLHAGDRASTATCSACSSKFVRAVLLVVGVLIALQAIGFDLTLLTVFGGALGVGIGLGLQKLASNYIAGFTILLDRSIRLGDMITVDNRFGVVAQGHVALRRRAQPRRRRGDRAERDAGHDHGAQPLVHEPARSRMAMPVQVRLRQRRRARAGADGGGRARRAAGAEGAPKRAGGVRRCASPTAASTSSSASGSATPKTASSTCEARSTGAIWTAFRRERHRDPVPAARRPAGRSGSPRAALAPTATRRPAAVSGCRTAGHPRHFGCIADVAVAMPAPARLLAYNRTIAAHAAGASPTITG